MSTLNELKYNVYNRFSGRKNLSYDDLRKAYPGEKNDAAKAIALFGLPENQAMYQWLNPINDGFDLLEKLGDRASVFIPGAMEPDGSHSVPGASLNPTVGTQVLGPELVTNGDFSNGLTGWATGAGATLANVGNQLQITNTSTNGWATNPTNVPAQVNSTYRVSITNAGTTAVTFYLRDGVGAAADMIGIMLTAGSSYTTDIVSNTSGFNIRAFCIGAAGAVALVDNISIKQVITMPGGAWLMDYVESTMNTPAAVDGPVGFLSDGEGTVGPELAPAMLDFTSASWTRGGGATAASATVVNFPSTGAEVFQAGTGVNSAGKSYFVRFVASGNGTLSVGVTNTINYAPRVQFSLSSTPREFICKIDQDTTTTATAAISFCRLAGDTCTQATISAASWKQLNGRHATQGTGASKPVLRRGLVNQFKYSKDLTQHAAYAAQNGGTFPAPDTVNCTATYNSGFRFEVSTNTDAFIAPAVGKYTIAIDIAAGTLSSIYIGLDPGNSTATSNAPGLVALTADYQTIAVNVDVTVAGTVFRIFVLNQTGIAGTFKVRGMGLFMGTFTAAEIAALGGIPLTTTAAASSALGNYALEFDGNRVLLASAPFQPSEDHILIAGALNRVADTASKSVLCIGNAGQGFAEVSFSPSGSVPRAVWKDDSSAQVTITHDTTVLNAPVVITGRKVGNTRSLRINSAAKGTDTTVLGASVASTLAVGARFTVGAAGSSLFGPFYGGIVVRGTLTDAELLTLERFVAALTGPTGITI